jgi:hypothetical protein
MLDKSNTALYNPRVADNTLAIVGEATVKYRAVLVFIVFAFGLPDATPADQAPAFQKRAPVPEAKKPATDVSGTWALVATFKGPPGAPDGGFRATVTLKQRDVALDGYLTYPNGEGGAFTGAVIDQAVTFTAVFKNPERPGVTNITDFTGTLDGEKAMKGHVTSVATGPGTYRRGEGPFVATRRPSSASR